MTDLERRRKCGRFPVYAIMGRKRVTIYGQRDPTAFDKLCLSLPPHWMAAIDKILEAEGHRCADPPSGERHRVLEGSQ